MQSVLQRENSKNSWTIIVFASSKIHLQVFLRCEQDGKAKWKLILNIFSAVH